MKVTKPDVVRNNVELASRMGFLRQAKQVTLQSLADSVGTQRSNLSAFVTSAGRTRNVSYDKLDKALFILGMLPDGTLTPQLHRWLIDEDMVSFLCEILIANDFQSGLLMRLSKGNTVYLVVKITGNTLVFVSLDAGIASVVSDGLGVMADRVRDVNLDRSGDSSIQSLWMTPDDARVEKLLLSLFHI